MMVEKLVRKWIYHITDWRNLSSIIESGGLWCKHELETQNLNHRSAAHEQLNARRRQTQVPAGGGGMLTDYVPWSFGRRSPMLCAIANGRVHNVDQHDIVHLGIHIQQFIEQDYQWVFCDGHPVVSLTKWYDHIAQLDKIDWPLMEEDYWHNTKDDPDRTRRRQAEFLVPTFVPWNLVEGIGVSNPEIVTRVKGILGSNQTPPVIVKADWYYN